MKLTFLDRTALSSPPSRPSLINLHHRSLHGHIAWMLLCRHLLSCLRLHSLRTGCLSEVPLIVLGPELLLEPVDHVLEWVMVLVMEEEALRFDLYELLYHLDLGDVAQDHVLRILLKDCEPVWDTGIVLLLLLLYCFRQVVKGLG